MHKQSSSSTLAQLVHGSDAQQMQPVMLRDVHVDGVLCGPDGGAALRDQPANGAALPSVPMLLLRDASLQQGADSVAHYVHSGLRGLFSGPAARLGAGAQGHAAGQTCDDDCFHHDRRCVHNTSVFPKPNTFLTLAIWLVVHTGCRLRLGNCRLQRRNKVTGQAPRLLPTAETVLVLDSLEAAPQLLATQLFPLSPVRPKAPTWTCTHCQNIV